MMRSFCLILDHFNICTFFLKSVKNIIVLFSTLQNMSLHIVRNNNRNTLKILEHILYQNSCTKLLKYKYKKSIIFVVPMAIWIVIPSYSWCPNKVPAIPFDRQDWVQCSTGAVSYTHLDVYKRQSRGYAALFTLVLLHQLTQSALESLE